MPVSLEKTSQTRSELAAPQTSAGSSAERCLRAGALTQPTALKQHLSPTFFQGTDAPIFRLRDHLHLIVNGTQGGEVRHHEGAKIQHMLHTLSSVKVMPTRRHQVVAPPRASQMRSFERSISNPGLHPSGDVEAMPPPPPQWHYLAWHGFGVQKTPYRGARVAGHSPLQPL